MTVYILRGYSGSGKTTWRNDNIPGATVASRDLIRKALTGRTDKFAGDWEFEKLVSSVQESIVREAVKSGLNVVIDDTNLTKKYAMRWVNLATELGEDFEVVDFKVDVETCIERNTYRPVGVPPSVIRDQAKRFPFKQWPVLEPASPEGSKWKTYVPDKSLPSAWIVDIDGTVADLPRGFSPYDPSHYSADIPNHPVIKVVEGLDELGFEIIYVSGRGEEYRAETEKWIREHSPWMGHLYMRPVGDKRGDDIVKSEIFDEHIAPYYNVWGAIDDRKRVTEMWRARGITVLQVKEGDY